MKLYVGNLPYKADENVVRSTFEAFGQVSAVTLIKDKITGRAKGFGFVEMPDDSQAKTAIAGMNGKELLGRALNVNEARPLENRPSRGGGFDRGGGGSFDRGSRAGSYA